MSRLSWSPRRPTLLLLLLAVGSLFLGSCRGRIANTNWAGLSSDGQRVYLAFGPRVIAYNPATKSQDWIYPPQAGAVQFYSAPSAEKDRVIFGDYGQAGGFLSPRVTVSIYSLDNVKSGVPAELWKNSQSATDKVVAPPLQVGDKVFVGTADNHVLALDVNNGTELWDFKTSHAIWGQPSYRGGVLYVASMDWSVYAISADTGDKVWETRLGGALSSGPVLGDELLYISSFDGNVHALEIDSGKERWAAPAISWVWGAPALADGVIYFSDIKGNVFAADALTGEQKWTISTGTLIQSSPVVVGDTLYIASQANGNAPSGALTAYATVDGTQKWSKTTNAPLLATPVLVGDNTIVVGLQSADTLLIGFDLATGQELWQYSLSEEAN